MLFDQHQNVEQVAQLTNVPTRTFYNWLSDWKQLKESTRKPVHYPIRPARDPQASPTNGLRGVPPRPVTRPLYPSVAGPGLPAADRHTLRQSLPACHSMTVGATLLQTPTRFGASPCPT